MINKKNFLVGVIAFLVFTFNGCTYKTIMYSGPKRTPDQIAVLKGGTRYVINSVDGTKKIYTRQFFGWELRYEIHLPPGWHVISFEYKEHTRYGVWSSRKETELKFRAEAGHVYTIEWKPVPSKFDIPLSRQGHYEIVDITRKNKY